MAETSKLSRSHRTGHGSEEMWAKALSEKISRTFRWYTKDMHTLENCTQEVLLRVLEHARELGVSLLELRDAPELERQVVKAKVEAVRSQLRRDRKRATVALTEVADKRSGAEKFEAKDRVAQLLARASLSDQERRFAAVFLSALAPDAQAELLGVPRDRLPKLKHKLVQKLRPLMDELISH